MKLTNEFVVPAPVDRAWEVLLDLERVAPCLPGARLEGGDGRDFQGQMSVKIGPVTSRYRGSVRIEQVDADARRAIMRAQARDAGGSGTAAATISTAMRPVDGGTLVTVRTDIQISGPAAQFGRGVMQEVSGKLMDRFAACLADEMRSDAQPVQPPAVGANAATPADVASGRTANGGAPAPTTEWAAAAAAGPSMPGGYDDTPVGRLPTGPAGDAALAAASGTQTTPPRPRPTEEVLDLGKISQRAVLKRLVPSALVVVAAIAGAIAWRRRERA